MNLCCDKELLKVEEQKSFLLENISTEKFRIKILDKQLWRVELEEMKICFWENC
jgi:hypothetical protein